MEFLRTLTFGCVIFGKVLLFLSQRMMVCFHFFLTYRFFTNTSLISEVLPLVICFEKQKIVGTTSVLSFLATVLPSESSF